MADSEDKNTGQVDDEAVELFANYVKNELDASEQMDELVSKYTVEEIEMASQNVINKLLQNIDDEKRKKTIYVILARVGDTIGSTRMLTEGKKKLEAMVDK